MVEINRRLPPDPGDISALPWNAARTPVARALRWARDNAFGIPGGFKATAPVTATVGGTATAGTEGASWMAADAQIVLATGTPSSLGNANAPGSSSSAPRLDHVHKRDVRIAKAGSDVGTRNRINFANTDTATITVTDDAGNDEVDVSVDATATLEDALFFASFVGS